MQQGRAHFKREEHVDQGVGIEGGVSGIRARSEGGRERQRETESELFFFFNFVATLRCFLVAAASAAQPRRRRDRKENAPQGMKS
jgi:hypothetical protein